jgi:hypothetical protein
MLRRRCLRALIAPLLTAPATPAAKRAQAAIRALHPDDAAPEHDEDDG